MAMATAMTTEVCWHCRRVRATGGGISLAGDGSIGPACVRTMRAIIADAVLVPAAVAGEGIGNMDGKRGEENIILDAVEKVFDPAAVMVVVAPAAVVEYLARHAVMEAWALLLLQGCWCGGTDTGGSTTAIV